MEISCCWDFLEKILTTVSVIPEIKWKSVAITPELKEAAIFLRSPGMSSLLEEWLMETIFQDLSKRVGPAFWKFFTKTDDEADTDVLSTAFGFLYDSYKDYYLVSLIRLQWLQSLAVLAPVSGQSSLMSAFTPVKAATTFTKGVRFGNLNRQKSLTSTLAVFKSERASKIEAGQLSVTFEKGTKGEEMEVGLNEDSIEDNSFQFKQVLSVDDKRTIVSMEGSFCPDKSLEDSLEMDRGLSLLNPILNISANNRISNIMEEEEDEESFIRSPIGGSKKFHPSSVNTRKATQPLSVIKTPLLSDEKTNLQGVSIHQPSITSTPGEMLTQTPGNITPISFISTPDELYQVQSSQSDRPSFPVATPAPDDPMSSGIIGSCGYLPDASEVFGITIPNRPIPCSAHQWQSTDQVKMLGVTQSRVQLMIRSVLFYTFPQPFKAVVKNFYSEAFEIHRNQADESAPSQLDLEKSQKRFDTVNKKLDEMGLMELISGSAVTEIVHCQIEKHIEDSCKGNFDTSHIGDLEEWLDQHVLGWLKQMYACKQTASQMASVVAFRDRLRHFIYETYAKSLIVQFFDIIIDYPDSKPAIQDLSACLEKTDLRSELVSSLKNALESRLLHPGVNTADILTAYIAAIKSLRLLEPAGVILELVCEPVGRYLRSREDTVRCIVASLTDEGNNELISELVNTKPVGDENQQEDGNMVGWESWMPDPVDADPSTVSKNRRSADILSTLVNIYGSKELFVNEYRALLADRILMQYNYDVERELRYLELLKLRFGEAQLHFCEVMLRDVTESRRVNARIQDARKNINKHNEMEMNAMILSAQFWPAFRDEKITLPPELQEHLDKYTKAFEMQKQNRTLLWKPHLGLMNIEIELKEETLNFSVSPVQAAIIMKFQNKTKWTVDELSSELEMTASVLRRKIAFWQGQGLLREISTDVYQLVEEKRGRPNDLIMMDEEEIESAMASAQQQKEEEMQVFWTYIQGMLANLDCLTLERIHAMLRMFAMEEPSSSEVTTQELKSFLDNKVKDQVLIFSGGVYRLNK
ncbi:Anaphase-promoting complex subunit 2 [Bulinus truncatus]|nr:Anaphase-promoting complex subunit 2 [Bulinus truncatus]